jgi:hypothetical protein
MISKKTKNKKNIWMSKDVEIYKLKSFLSRNYPDILEEYESERQNERAIFT